MARTSYDDGSIKESVLNLIVNLSVTETQLYTGLQKSKAISTYHEWIEDGFTKATSVSVTNEGAAWGAASNTDPVRAGNYTQIITDVFQVTGTTEATDHYGMGSRVGHESVKSMENWKNKVEYSLIHGAINAGTAGTPNRQMGGIREWLVNADGTTHVSGVTLDTYDDNGAVAVELTETLFNTYLQRVWNQGGEVDAAYVGGLLKRKISTFTAGNERQIQAKDKRLVSAVDVYESDFGIVKIFKHRYVETPTEEGLANRRVLMLLQEDTWGVAHLRSPEVKDTANDGDYVKKVVIGELTLEARAPHCNYLVEYLNDA